MSGRICPIKGCETTPGIGWMFCQRCRLKFPRYCNVQEPGASVADLAVARHHARNAYEEACADWRTAAENQQYQGRSAALMGSAHAVYKQADRALDDAIAQMLIDGKRISAGAGS